MSPNLHFVAFIDLLGFAEMVRADCEAPDGTQTFLALLNEVHEATRKRLTEPAECELVQFSDSVVLSRPFEPKGFEPFLKLVAAFQRDLVVRGLLCRGGIAYGKHYSSGTFMFSQGLINAYRLEQSARFPRVVVSQDLLKLLVPKQLKAEGLPLMIADDNVPFINFIDEDSLPSAINVVKEHLEKNDTPDIREKALWLARYLEFASGTNGVAPSQFRNYEA